MTNGTAQGSAADVAARARRIAREVLEPRAAEVDLGRAFPFDSVSALAAAGFTGMTLPLELGGWQVNLHAALAVIEQVAQTCGTSGRVMVDLNLGIPVAAMRHAHEGALRQLGGRVLAGQLPAMCVDDANVLALEPPATDDAGRPRVTVARARGRQFVISGVKEAVSGAGVSDVYAVTAELRDGTGAFRGRGVFLLLRNETDGIEVSNARTTLGTRGLPVADVSFNDVLVPSRNLLYVLESSEHLDARKERARLAAPDVVGRVLELERYALCDAAHGHALGLAAVSVGIATGALGAGVRLGMRREVAGELGVRVQAARSLLFGAAASADATRTAVSRSASEAARTVDDELPTLDEYSLAASLMPDPTVSARARLFASAESLAVCNRCIDAVGARALTRATPLERYLRDARMLAASGREAALLSALAADELYDRRSTVGALRQAAGERRALRDALTVLPPPRPVPIPD